MELLLIFAISLFVLLTIILLSSGQLGTISALKGQNDAHNSVMDVSAAAKDVYAQGEGAKKQVYVYMPSGYEPGESFVSNRSLVINVDGTDYVSSEGFDVHGSWPGTPGGHWVWVISEGNKVRIGTAMLHLSKNAISVIMDRNSSASASFYAENIWGRDIDVVAQLSWAPSDVSVIQSTSSFHLTPGQKQPISLTISSNGQAVGHYGGELAFIATEANNTETVRLPISVEVVGNRADEAPPLNVTPDLWTERLDPTNSSTALFTICTNSYTSVSGVTFSPSSGAPGGWVENAGPLGPMSGGSCALKSMAITVPPSTADGVYRGTIDVAGEGAVGAQDTINLFIVVGNGNDSTTCSPFLDNTTLCNCPVGSLYWDIPVCMCQPATIYVQNGTVFGGPGNGTSYNGTIQGGSGTDIIAGTDGNDLILGDESGDLICGHGGDDLIYGYNGDDILDGGRGDDILYGESGYDKLYGKEDSDMIFGGQGNDQIDGGGGNDFLYGEAQDDLMYGGPGNDLLDGGVNKDTMCGNADDDTLYAGDGNDELDGGTGFNILDGGGSGGDCYNGQTQYNCTAKPGYLNYCGLS
ncbi:hypothetical protein L0Y65_03100 [Candidatus Micrarchaeota archaeon]|nr:hypothetical protein [Candidatus Micrarchaeota archaeon]